MLRQLEEYAKLNNVPIMNKDAIEYLCNYIKEHNIKSILEVGTAIGYSSIKMALTSDDITVVSLEKDTERYNIAIDNINKFNLSDRITVYNMDALDYTCDSTFDLVFIDASKGKNKAFFEKFSKNLSYDGTIITDNISFHGLLEDSSLIKTKNQQKLVGKIKDYITYLGSNKEFNTKYIPVGDTIAISKRRNRLIINVQDREALNSLYSYDIEGIIVSIDSLSSFGNFYVHVNELEQIIDRYKGKKVIVSLNKVMSNDDLQNLEEVLKRLKNMKIFKILFYDMAVYNIASRLDMTNLLVIYQEHLNASIYSNNFYKRRNINSTYITSDITFEEIKEIKINTNMEIFMNVYGHIPMFYSRRSLITNYFKYIDRKPSSSYYYLQSDDDSCMYPIKQEESGTVIYTPKINLINRLDELSEIDYLVINLFDEEDYKKILRDFLQRKKINEECYEGFFNKKTIFKLKEGSL